MTARAETLARDYRNSHQDETHAASYDASFRDTAHKAIMWRLEQEALEDVLRRYYGGQRVAMLDFACGTGRIASFLERRGVTGVCVDLSPAMLAYARTKLSAFDLIEADLTRDDVLGHRTFDLITAFRFFPNAEPELRRDAIHALVRHMAPGAFLVFNNHQNHTSLQYRVMRLFHRPGAELSMTQGEVDDLLREGGLKVVRVYPIGLLPAITKRLPVPSRLLERFERAATGVGWFRPLFENLVFVCQRAAY